MGNEQREKFADIMHAIRNAVTVMLISAEYLESAPDGPVAQEAFADMREASGQLGAAVGRLEAWKRERDR